MTNIIIAAGFALVFVMVGTPVWIRIVNRLGYGQMIRDEGPEAHLTKRGTPMWRVLRGVQEALE